LGVATNDGERSLNRLQAPVDKHPSEAVHIAWNNASSPDDAEMNLSSAGRLGGWCSCTCPPTALGSPRLRLLLHGEFAIAGFTNKALQQGLPDKTFAQGSHLLKRLRVHKLIKKVGQRYKYYLTDSGRHVAKLVFELRELHVIPTLAHSPSAN
jgi:hypothetical protein